MSGLQREILALHDSGCNVAEICGELELEDVAVKSVLAQYRASGDNVEIDSNELTEFIEAYKMLRHSEEPHIQERVLRNLINYKKDVTDGLGANDPKKLAKLVGTMSGTVNVLVLNKVLSEIRDTKQRMLSDIVVEQAS